MAKKLIKIVPETHAAIDAALDSIQKRCSVNLHSAGSLEELAARAESKLEQLGIAKSHRAGAVFESRAAGPGANAYKYAQGATRVRLVRRSSGWYLDQAGRVAVYPRTPKIDRLTLSPQQDAVAIAVLRRQYLISAPVAPVAPVGEQLSEQPTLS